MRRTQGAYADSVHYSATGWQNTDVTISAGRATSQHFNSWGLVDQVTDAAGYTNQLIYDGIGRVQTAIGPRADTTTYYYDALFLTGVKDAKGQLYQYVRNGLGWTTQQIDPRNASTYFGYDRNGNITSTTNRRGQTIAASYDSLDEMTTRIAGTDTATYATDPLGRFVAVRNVESVDTVMYDPADRMTSEITVRKGVRYVRASTYDIRGQRTGVAFTSQPWGTSVSTGYRYDALERLDSLVDMTGGATVIAYDSLDRPISTTLPNGDQIGTPFANLMRPTDLTYSRSAVNSAIGASYAYGPRGELTDRIAPSSTAGRQFDTDSAGQLVGFENYTMTPGACTYQPMPPDPPERVCTGLGKSYSGASASYSWDKVGNPTYNGAVTDIGNRLRQFGSDSLAYDADGNLIGRYQNHALVESFVWDALGQLTSVTLGSTTLNFGYDGFGRRVRKRVSVNGVLHTTNFFHDGDNLWIIADQDGKHLVSVTASYPGIDQPHSIYQNGAISYYLQDVSGNITGLVNTAGTLQNRYSYLPFGAADTTVEAVTNTLKFAAREYDAEVGLYYVRARYYDPGLGRFISEDPAGIKADINAYVYAGNTPTDARDPSGLMSWEQTTEWIAHPCALDSSCGYSRGGAIGNRGISTLGFAGDDLGWTAAANASIAAAAATGPEITCKTSALQCLEILNAAVAASVIVGGPTIGSWPAGTTLNLMEGIRITFTASSRLAAGIFDTGETALWFLGAARIQGIPGIPSLFAPTVNEVVVNLPGGYIWGRGSSMGLPIGINGNLQSAVNITVAGIQIRSFNPFH